MGFVVARQVFKVGSRPLLPSGFVNLVPAEIQLQVAVLFVRESGTSRQRYALVLIVGAELDVVIFRLEG